MATKVSPLLTVLVIGVILALTHGHYQGDLVIVLFCTLSAYFITVFKTRESNNSNSSNQVAVDLLFFCTLVFALLLAFDNELIYASQVPYTRAIKLITVTSLLFVLASLSIATQLHRSDRNIAIAVTLMIAASICLVAARVLVPLASPEPVIDVFWINTWAARDFLQGINPYSTSYKDIYNGAYGYTPGFTYWPGYLIAVAPMVYAEWDIRILSIIADLIVAGVLWSFAVEYQQALTRWTAVTMWLAMPTSLFVIEQAWIDNFLLAIVALAFYCLQHRRLVLAGCLFGLAAATKQYGFVPLAIVVASMVVGNSARQGAKLVSAALVTILIVFTPFIVWDLHGLFRNTVSLLFTIPMRPDSLSVIALLANQYAFQVPGVVLICIYVSTLLGACFLLRKNRNSTKMLLQAVALVYAILFMFGKQAFCNYYVMLSGLLLLAIVNGTTRSPARI